MRFSAFLTSSNAWLLSDPRHLRNYILSVKGHIICRFTDLPIRETTEWDFPKDCFRQKQYTRQKTHFTMNLFSSRQFSKLLDKKVSSSNTVHLILWGHRFTIKQPVLIEFFWYQDCLSNLIGMFSKQEMYYCVGERCSWTKPLFRGIM